MTMAFMKRRRFFRPSILSFIFGSDAWCSIVLSPIVWGLLIPLMAPRRMMAEPAPAAVSAFNEYVRKVEARLGRQHLAREGFLATAGSAAQNEQRLRRGELVIEQLSPQGELPGAMLQDWRGTAFAPGASAADFERLLKDFDAYPKRFAPQVIQAKVLSQRDDCFRASMRVRQKHVLTVVMDTVYDIGFGRLDEQDGYSDSRSTAIYEIGAPGTDREHALSPKDEHGFLWRLNTYWTYQERDGGLYIQIESVSLSRSIPAGLGWALRPYVESVPRESLEFTLRSAVNAVRK